MSPSASQPRVAASSDQEPERQSDQEPEQESDREPSRGTDRASNRETGRGSDGASGRESGEGADGGRSRAADRSGTVRKGLALLELLAEYPHGATAGQLVADSGYAFSTCYRLLSTLVDAGYAEYEPATKQYRLGLLLFAMGQKAATARGYAGTALPVMREVVEATGESCLLGVLDGDRFLTVHTVDGPHHRITTDPGDRGELHTSSLGRVLLAFAAPDVREDLMASLDLTARTERSLTDRERLRAIIAQVREQGWALQDQEHDDGMAALAVPVMSPGAPLQAALALAAPVHRCDPAQLVQNVPLLREAADRLAVVLPQRS